MNVLFLNNDTAQSDEHQYGIHLFEILRQSTIINFIYKEVSNLDAFNQAVQNGTYVCILYNYSATTMCWLTQSNIQKTVKNINVASCQSPIFDINCDTNIQNMVFSVVPSFSQAYQDIFLRTMSRHKTNGTFLEIGTNDPIKINNTYSFSKYYNWHGILVEYDTKYKNIYAQTRPNDIAIIQDARTINYKQMLDTNNFPVNIDYLQIDLDVDNRSTLDVLELLDQSVFDTYKFGTVTFEHDIYRGNYFNTREVSRQIFLSRGYILIFADVSNDNFMYEDWYVHPDIIAPTVLADIKQLADNCKDNSCNNIKKLLLQYTIE